MRDGSIVHLAKIEQLPGGSPPSLLSLPLLPELKWLTQDVGRQLLTGSFHPIDDNKWSDVITWHKSLTQSPNGVPRHTFASLFGALRQANTAICAKVFLTNTTSSFFSTHLTDLGPGWRNRVYHEVYGTSVIFEWIMIVLDS
jgi:hypothetical protein